MHHLRDSGDRLLSRSTLRVAYRKRGLLRLVAHRDMGTHLRRMFLRARLPMRYSEGFSPKPRFHFAPPLPLGATCGEDWLDVDLDGALTGDEFLSRVADQALQGLDWRHAFVKPEGAPPLHELLLYGEWNFEPYEGTGGAGHLDTMVANTQVDELILRKRSKRGKLRELDVRSRIKVAEKTAAGARVVLAASPNAPEGPLGLFDYLRVVLPDLEEHPMTCLKIERTRFLREVDGALAPAITPPEAPAPEPDPA